MRYICDAGDLTWFRIETTDEAAIESRDMGHSVEKYYVEAEKKAAQAFVPPKGVPVVEQRIGLKSHVQRAMPIFVTLRDRDGTAHVTAMLPPAGEDEQSFRPIVVGPSNTDPFAEQGDAINALAEHFGLTLDSQRCYPYRRS